MTKTSNERFDVFIVGAGPVGASLALALEGHGLAVGLAEARPLGDPGQPSYDDKALALTGASVKALDTLGVWPEVAHEATPIRQVHVSQRGRLGITRLNASDAGMDALGQVVPARALGAAFNGRLRESPGLRLYCPARLKSAASGEEGRVLELEGETGPLTVATRLLVGADGTRSPVRELLGIAAKAGDGAQHALAANVTPEFDHGGCAYERFTPGGPLALLPMSGGRMGMVWTGDAALIEELDGLSDAALLSRLQAAFGMRLGRFTRIGARKRYPLTSVVAERQTAERAVLLGNASQTLHPVAAQGFNLALRDVAALAELLVEAAAEENDPGDPALLRRFQAWRAGDRRRTRRFTGSLVRGFSSDFAPLAHARGLALFALDLAPPVKRAFMRRALGLADRPPLLLVGGRLGAHAHGPASPIESERSS